MLQCTSWEGLVTRVGVSNQTVDDESGSSDSVIPLTIGISREGHVTDVTYVCFRLRGFIWQLSLSLAFARGEKKLAHSINANGLLLDLLSSSDDVTVHCVDGHAGVSSVSGDQQRVRSSLNLPYH